jgi:dCTP deaminase
LGVLTDEDIVSEVGQGNLIVEDFSPIHVKQACYELRAGNVYYDLSGGKTRIHLEPGSGFVLLKPYQLAVVITRESLALPADVIGRILMKGKLFSLGLQPVNTYADPGFKGRLGIVIFNSSPRFIRIDQGDAIAKIEFERLHGPVKSPYSGQHGYQTEIWPIPDYMYVATSEARRDPRVRSAGEELRLAFGEDLGNVVDRVFRYERLLLLSTIGYTGLAVVIIVYSESTGNRLSTLVAFIVGLLTNVVSGFLAYAGTSLGRRLR